jgi:hypothetical protein
VGKKKMRKDNKFKVGRTKGRRKDATRKRKCNGKKEKEKEKEK